MATKIIISIVLSAIIVIFIGAVYLWLEDRKKRTEKQNELREHCTPIRGEVVDFFITLSVNIRIRIKFRNSLTKGDTCDWSFYPIIKDELTGKLYISYGDFDCSSYYTTNVYGPGFFKYNFINNGKKINIGDSVNIYINKEIQNLPITNDKFYIEENEWRYLGKRENTLPVLLPGKYAFNEMNENFMDLAKNVIVYDGFFEGIDYN